MANLHILSPQEHEGMDVSRCMVGSVKSRFSMNSDKPWWIFEWEFCTLMSSKRLQGGKGSLKLRWNVGYLWTNHFLCFGIVYLSCDAGW